MINTSLNATVINTSVVSAAAETSSLRPDTFSEYIGQKKVIENLKVYIASAKQRESCLDHILLYGPAGLGKTTLSQIIANEMGSNIKITSAPAIEKSGELASILCKLENNDVLFIDEIHRLPKVVEEFLYSAMEDRRIDLVVGQGELSRSISMELPQFTLIGATTRAGMLSAPLRDRFGIVERLEYYSPDELSLIIKRSAKLLNMAISDAAALYLARCSRGTPRIANNYLKRCRDFATVAENTIIDEGIILSCMNNLGVSKDGYNELDQRVLGVLEKIDKPVGISTLASMVGEDVGTLENVVEPFLIYTGVLLKTPRGRILASKV